MSEQADFWAVVELMGHVRMAGRLTEEERFGAKLGRLDVPTREGGFTTVWFGGASVYRLTAVSEEAARTVALASVPQPVHRWELPAPRRPEDETNYSQASAIYDDEDRDTSDEDEWDDDDERTPGF